MDRRTAKFRMRFFAIGELSRTADTVRQKMAGWKDGQDDSLRKARTEGL